MSDISLKSSATQHLFLELFSLRPYMLLTLTPIWIPLLNPLLWFLFPILFAPTMSAAPASVLALTKLKFGKIVGSHIWIVGTPLANWSISSSIALLAPYY